MLSESEDELVDFGLPGYTPSRTITTVEHTRTANRSADTILKFRSHAFCPDSIPVLLSRQRITGSVELSLKKKTTLKSVVVKVRGYRISPFTRAREEKTFVEASTVLWPDKNGAKTVRQGIYSWKFSLSLPPTTTSLSKEGSAIALPPSFSDTQSTEYIKYELVLLVDKGMFSVDSGIITPFIYIPQTYAESPHPAMQTAYSDLSELPNPQTCPPAWKTTSFLLEGRLFSQRDVELDGNLSLSLPGQYARGAFVHIHLSITSDDTQALDSIASPKACSVLLARRLSNRGGAKGIAASELVVKSHLAHGRLWPAPSSQANTRAFYGEIPVSKELQTNFAIPTISLSVRLSAAYIPVLSAHSTTHARQYLVELKIAAIGFAVSSPLSHDGIVVSLPVIITARKAAGQAPRSLAPAPSYGEDLPNPLSQTKGFTPGTDR